MFKVARPPSLTRPQRFQNTRCGNPETGACCRFESLRRGSDRKQVARRSLESLASHKNSAIEGNDPVNVSPEERRRTQDFGGLRSRRKTVPENQE